MEKKQGGQDRNTANDIEGADEHEVTEPRKLLEYLLKKTEEMERRLARILEEYENLGDFDNP